MTDPIRRTLMLPPGSPVERGPQWTDLWIREGTSDEDVLDEIWLQDVYHVRGLGLQSYVARIGEQVDPIITPIVVDLGACTGIFTAFMCAMYPDVRVIAVEPDAENLEILKRNVAPFAERVDVWHAAVGMRDGLTALVGEAGTAHTEPSLDGPEVRMVSLATIIHDVGGPVALLKCDIEGAEYDVLIGADLSQIDRIHMEWHGSSECPWLSTSSLSYAQSFSADPGEMLYGALLAHLAKTHGVEVFGDPAAGGYLFAHRYNDSDSP